MVKQTRVSGPHGYKKEVRKGAGKKRTMHHSGVLQGVAPSEVQHKGHRPRQSGASAHRSAYASFKGKEDRNQDAGNRKKRRH